MPFAPLNVQDRARVLSKWSDLIANNSSDLAGLMCLESGKPKAEAKGELNYARSFINMYAGMQSNGLVLPPQTNNHMLLATKEVRTSEDMHIKWTHLSSRNVCQVNMVHKWTCSLSRHAHHVDMPSSRHVDSFSMRLFVASIITIMVQSSPPTILVCIN